MRCQCLSGVAALTAGTHVLILNLADKVTMLHIIITLEGRPTEDRVRRGDCI